MSDARKATLQDLVAQTYEFEIESPSGEALIIDMRAPTPAEVLDVDRRNKRPEPDVIDFRKTEDGQVQPVYGFEKPEYKAALEEWANRRMRLLILLAWQADVPGDTEDDKLEGLNNLSAWALSGLWRATQLLISTSENAIKHRPFRAE